MNEAIDVKPARETEPAEFQLVQVAARPVIDRSFRRMIARLDPAERKAMAARWALALDRLEGRADE